MKYLDRINACIKNFSHGGSYKPTEKQRSIIGDLLNNLMLYINEFDDNEEFQKHTTESGGVTPHVAKELYDNIKRAFNIGGHDYGSDMCCFSKNDSFGEPFKIDSINEDKTSFGVFDSEGDCIFEGKSVQECKDYCDKNEFNYIDSENKNFSESKGSDKEYAKHFYILKATLNNLLEKSDVAEAQSIIKEMQDKIPELARALKLKM